MEFKKFPKKILLHKKTFNKTNIRVLDHLLGVKNICQFFTEQSLFKLMLFENLYQVSLIF